MLWLDMGQGTRRECERWVEVAVDLVAAEVDLVAAEVECAGLLVLVVAFFLIGWPAEEGLATRSQEPHLSSATEKWIERESPISSLERLALRLGIAGESFPACQAV